MRMVVDTMNTRNELWRNDDEMKIVLRMIPSSLKLAAGHKEKPKKPIFGSLLLVLLPLPLLMLLLWWWQW
jgi:hypothetical protein